jgi:hypothetical protein
MDDRVQHGKAVFMSCSELVHPKVVVALVAPELFPAGVPGDDFKFALCLAFGAPAIDRLSRQHLLYGASP